MPYWALGLCALLVAANVVVTVALWSSQNLTASRMRLQIVVVWLIPVVGAALCWYILREEEHTLHGLRSSDGAGNEADSGPDYGGPDYYSGHHGGDGGGHDGGGHHGGDGH